jgi:regulatory associated protein of mTOR
MVARSKSVCFISTSSLCLVCCFFLPLHRRILLHYNGHGVPRPTSNGEIWVFDKNHTEYIPLAIADLRQWLGKPSILVLDCSSAGILIPFILPAVLADHNTATNATTAAAAVTVPTTTPGSPPPRRIDGTIDMDALSSQWVRDTIVLCPCSENEWLPMHPDYPADIFTSCLTTPIPIALRWFVRRNPASMSTLDPDVVDAIPGKANDRKTPLGELNWIFTAVTDSIAWNILPKPLFQRLFRQDLLVASMFRNFLLADRILRSLGCTPVSYPPLPPGIADHALWAAWDLACETLLYQLMKDGVLERTTTAAATTATAAAIPKGVIPPFPSSSLAHKSPTDDDDSETGGGASTTAATVDSINRTGLLKPNAAAVAPPAASPSTAVLSSSSSISSPFFSEQLTAFEVWLEFSAINKMLLANGTLESPEQLPVVLQVLLSQAHRIRALVLLRRFLDLGPWAVNLSLSLGIFPYVMKLLQSPEYKSLLVSIWASILAFDPSCRVDLLKDGAL